jgi:hypothetical protein
MARAGQPCQGSRALDATLGEPAVALCHHRRLAHREAPGGAPGVDQDPEAQLESGIREEGRERLLRLVRCLSAPAVNPGDATTGKQLVRRVGQNERLRVPTGVIVWSRSGGAPVSRSVRGSARGGPVR